MGNKVNKETVVLIESKLSEIVSDELGKKKFQKSIKKIALKLGKKIGKAKKEKAPKKQKVSKKKPTVWK